MTSYQTDVAVIGAGTAGLAAERHARQAGASTLLIDPAFAGTTCASVGCMPSKLLIAAADAAQTIREGAQFGLGAKPDVDGAAVMQRVRRLRDDFVAGVRSSIAKLPDGVAVTARARFDGPGRLLLETGDTVEARAIVIATGSSSLVPEAFSAVSDLVLTNESLFELEDLPHSIGVIGGGPVGLELAQALSRLGVDVTLFEGSDRIGGLPKAQSDSLYGALTREFPIHLNTEAEAAPDPDGVRLTWPGNSAVFERLLLAAGRPPNFQGLDLDRAGIELDENGAPVFDRETMQCSDSAVFIAGDANADRPVLHEASDEGTIAGRNAAAWPDVSRAVRKVPLTVTFTRPEAAVIGTLPENPDDCHTGVVDFGDQGRARAMGQAHGLCHVHATGSDGKLSGAALCAPGAEHLAHLLAWAMQCGLTATEVLDLPFYHPTLAEGLQTALRDICSQTGQAGPWQRDDDPLPGDLRGASWAGCTAF
ncbi:dihydrolipoyl dehydrogenase [Lutimaribacter marinistellae]|uniref:Dihydrolipoyl dehydrogenase n=1 Tax=Lutimaribacter marinistellae TaxID=1820329 RepID=A0ABV7TA75_9RHOB